MNQSSERDKEMIGLIYGCIKIDGNIKFEMKEKEFKLKEKFLYEHLLNFKVEKSVKILNILNEYQLFGLDKIGRAHV